MRNKRIVANCICCSVNFDPSICSQCQVAGCAANKKGEKCRLSSNQRAAQKLSEFQLRERLAEVEKQYAELLAEAQRLARVNADYEANWPKGVPRLDVGAPAATNVMPLQIPQRSNITVTERTIS